MPKLDHFSSKRSCLNIYFLHRIGALSLWGVVLRLGVVLRGRGDGIYIIGFFAGVHSGRVLGFCDFVIGRDNIFYNDKNKQICLYLFYKRMISHVIIIIITSRRNFSKTFSSIIHIYTCIYIYIGNVAVFIPQSVQSSNNLYT